VRRKKRTDYVDIEMPPEVQTIQRYVDSLKICEANHFSKKQPSEFQKECDAVAEKLTKEKVVTLDIVIEKIPSATRVCGYVQSYARTKKMHRSLYLQSGKGASSRATTKMTMNRSHLLNSRRNVMRLPKS
jgi:hypothetical protein